MDAGSVRARRAIRGVVIGSAWVAALLVVEPLVGGFAIAAIAEGIIVRSPGWLSTTAISLLGFYAKPALVAGVIVTVLAATAITTAVWPQIAVVVRRRIPAGVRPERPAIATWATILGWTVATRGAFLALGVDLSLASAAGFTFAVVLPTLTSRVLPSPVSPASRRRFLRRIGGVVTVGVLPLAGLRILFDRLSGSPESDRVAEPLERSVSPPSGDSAFDFDGMPPAVTSPRDHYVVDINVESPAVDPETWTLDVDGAVAQPYALRYDEILGHEASIEQTTTMVCISNAVGGDLIGTGHWTGIQLSDLVAAAEPADDAVDVVTHAADGYSEAIPIEHVEREDILLAYGLGQRTLATEHGFPVRLLIPGRYGMKMTKWITRIEIAETDHDAYWERRGWDEEAVVNTMSYVRGGERTGDGVVVGGVAFGGLETGVEEIAAVEVSVDDGETWHEADLESRLGDHAWRRWRYEFEAPDQRRFPVLSRAVDREGRVQTGERSSPRPSGATGWHRMVVRV